MRHVTGRKTFSFEAFEKDEVATQKPGKQGAWQKRARHSCREFYAHEIRERAGSERLEN